MKNKVAMLTVLFLCVFNVVANAKSYTKDEITKMVAKKKYPKLGKSEASDQSASFEICEKLVSEQRVGFASEGWPTKIITESSEKIVVEIWGTDAKTTLSCEKGQSRIVRQMYSL